MLPPQLQAWLPFLLTSYYQTSPDSFRESAEVIFSLFLDEASVSYAGTQLGPGLV